MTRKAGRVSEDTRLRLLEAATREFSEYGYQNSSLRRICTEAGVTTGALYFFFQGKEELFVEVISPVTARLLKILQAHYETEQQNYRTDGETGEDEDLRASEQVLEFYYQNKTVCDIILSHTNHPAVIRFFDQLIDIIDQQTIQLLTLMGKGTAVSTPSAQFTIHWLSHLQIDAILNLISHDFERETSREHLKIMIRFLRGGFFTLLQDEP